MKNTLKRELLVGGILVLFLGVGVAPGFAQTVARNAFSIEDSVDFSSPVLKDHGDFVEIVLKEANAVMTPEGNPWMPVFSKTFEFPLGTRVTSVEIRPSAIQTQSVEKQVRPVPTKQKIGGVLIPVEGIINEDLYNSMDAYPSTWYSYTTGAGLNKNNDHVLFVSCHITPVRYLPKNQLLQYSTHFSICITYDLPMPTVPASEMYQLVIVAPSEFSEQLQPLVTHKNNYNLSTIMVTLDNIYSSYPGRDNPEKIKYFIKHALDDWNTQYVLLVGDMKKLPIRVTYASWWETNLLSDQYYADIYNATQEFCSWDANGNDRFGEIDHQGNDLDGVDLYADIHVGRLACTDITEVTTVVNKIIAYEEETFNQIWFKRIILAGGDTFPVSMGAPAFVYEGEITNTKVAQNLPGFDTTYLWTSRHTLHFYTFNWAINRGAGFVSYAGHGFEHGWGTYRPNAMTTLGIYYYTPFIKGLKNGNKLPIIFFDACLTAKLDFNITDLKNYYPDLMNRVIRLTGLSEDPSIFYPCFAWSFLRKEGGGAIATIGSTRTAYTWVDSEGVYGGAGYLDVRFFASYSEGVTAGQMLTGAQNDYINNVEKDYFTLEEFMLLGDPSLLIGGYQ